jgi:tRNA G18 (ribose-2'-O)-methylase SpoU
LTTNTLSEARPLRLTISKPAKYVETIGKRKYLKLSSRRQHEYLAVLALQALEHKNFKGFFKRYKEMRSWAELDCYIPPDWLSEEEAVHEYFLFHNSFSHNPLDLDLNDDPGLPDQSLSWQPKFDVTVVLDQVRSPYNAGAVLRLIDNFGFSRLVHNSSWLRLDHPQLGKAARGSEKWVPVEFQSNLIDWFRTVKVPIIGLENDECSISIEEWQPVKSCVLVVGNEVYGIATGLRPYCDPLVKIPLLGFKQSMNLHHALAILAHKIVEGCGREDRGIVSARPI